MDGAGISVYGCPGFVKMNDNRTKDSYRSGKSLRILVVEDHSDTLQALSRLLTHFGHEISLADGAQFYLGKPVDFHELRSVLAQIAA